MSDGYVLDSSAILCLIGRETGVEAVLDIAEQAVISAVNVAEVISKLQERGGTRDEIEAGVADLKLNVVEFDTTQALHTGLLRSATRSKGLSLGDRACLALAASRGAIAVTTDKAWTDLEGIARVMLVR